MQTIMASAACIYVIRKLNELLTMSIKCDFSTLHVPSSSSISFAFFQYFWILVLQLSTESSTPFRLRLRGTFYCKATDPFFFWKWLSWISMFDLDLPRSLTLLMDVVLLCRALYPCFAFECFRWPSALSSDSSIFRVTPFLRLLVRSESSMGWLHPSANAAICYEKNDFRLFSLSSCSFIICYFFSLSLLWLLWISGRWVVSFISWIVRKGLFLVVAEYSLLLGSTTTDVNLLRKLGFGGDTP